LIERQGGGKGHEGEPCRSINPLRAGWFHLATPFSASGPWQA
jgi:hypothetical protein